MDNAVSILLWSKKGDSTLNGIKHGVFCPHSGADVEAVDPLVH